MSAPYGFTELICSDTDGEVWLLHEPLTYVSKDGRVFVVPAQFMTDFASVPRLFWRLYPRSGPWNEAAVLHDYNYRQHTLTKMTRKEVDQLFLEAMESLGVNRPTRYHFYWGVRLGAWGTWDRYTKKGPWPDVGHDPSAT
jgi:hypothetical protein